MTNDSNPEMSKASVGAYISHDYAKMSFILRKPVRQWFPQLTDIHGFLVNLYSGIIYV